MVAVEFLRIRIRPWDSPSCASGHLEMILEVLPPQAGAPPVCSPGGGGLHPPHPPVEEGAGGARREQHQPDVQDQVPVCRIRGPGHLQLLIENIERKEADSIIVLQGSRTPVSGQMAWYN